MVTNGDSGNIGDYDHTLVMLTITPMATMVSMATMVKVIPLATLAPTASLAPVASFAPMALVNGNVSSTFHTRHCTVKSMTPLESLVPLVSLTLMTLMNRHLHQWIANGAIDVIDAIGLYLAIAEDS